MAISGLTFVCRPHFPLRPLRPPLFRCFRKARLSSVAAIETLYDSSAESIADDKFPSFSKGLGVGVGGYHRATEWKKLNSEEHGISTSMITKPTRKVLNILKQKGYEVYLVGGCVRDLMLNRIPKDFDIITSAELREVVRTFSRCEIIGRRFPICHVHIGDTIVEVSSFSTSGRKYHVEASYNFVCPVDCDEKDYIRWRNCLQRDFTINGLMYDPYANIVYDYLGGLKDIKKAKVRTIVYASTSFPEDFARILRAIRIAARLGFRFSRETAHFVKHFSSSILKLDKGRLMMEMNYMMAYGSAEASLRLLWKFGLLEILLPFQAAYFVRCGFRRRDKRTNFLLSLFSNMDKLLAPDRPCHSVLWVGILAFHKALADRPRDPLVIATFGLAVHNGGDISEAVIIARRIKRLHDNSFHELLEPQILNYEELVNEVTDLMDSIKQVLGKMTDPYRVSQAMADYSQAPDSDLVFIPLALYLRVCRMFECVEEAAEKSFTPKQGRKIDYEMLAKGNLKEVRHTFARIVFDTLYPFHLT